MHTNNAQIHKTQARLCEIHHNLVVPKSTIAKVQKHKVLQDSQSPELSLLLSQIQKVDWSHSKN